MRRATLGWAALFALTGCQGESVDFERLFDQTTTRVSTKKTETDRVDRESTQVHQTPHLRDELGRYVHIRGVNVSGSHKAPPTEVHLALNNGDTSTPTGERTRPSRYPLVDTERTECLTDFPIPEDCIQPGPDGRGG